jgi:hypothetical protein
MLGEGMQGGRPVRASEKGQALILFVLAMSVVFVIGVIVVDFSNFEVWFVTGSQHLYGEATLRKVAEHSQEMAQWMTQSGTLPVKASRR